MSALLSLKNISRISLAATAIFAFSTSATADDAVKRGEAVYNGVGACAGCHGPKGAGDGPAAAALTPKPRNFSTGKYGIDTDGDGKTGTDADLMNILTNGAAKYGGSPLMAGRSDIPEADRKALIAFLRSLAS